VHALTHGAYLRIIVPPPDDPTLDTEIAIAISRDFAIEEPATSPATLTAACSEVGPRPSGEGDSSALFQQALHCFQKTCTSTLKGLTPLQAKIAPEHVRGTHLAASSSGTNQQPPTQRPLSRFFGRDFDTLQNFFRSQALIECEEEGRIAYVDTWYIHHDRRPRCEAPRAVKLFQDPAEWLTDILQPWDAEIDPTQDIMIYLVRPTPPCTPFECTLAHLIIEQAPRPDHAVALISIQDSRFKGPTITHMAVSLHSIMNAPAIIRVADMEASCQSRACSVRRGQIPYDFIDFDFVESGCNIVISLRAPGLFGPLTLRREMQAI
jgi:hypothetical protein